MPQSRVDVRHWLEDTRDAYPFSLEEAVITELVANALDAKASRIEFLTELRPDSLVVMDNGQGMSREQLEDYHDFATSRKVRGQGIGFAGLGAKLALLVGDVVTETRTRGGHYVTRWHLAAKEASWDDIGSPGLLPSTGTRIRIELSSGPSTLVDSNFLQATIQRHFYPLLHPRLQEFLGKSYRDGVAFYVNGRQVNVPLAPPPQIELSRTFSFRRWDGDERRAPLG